MFGNSKNPLPTGNGFAQLEILPNRGAKKVVRYLRKILLLTAILIVLQILLRLRLKVYRFRSSWAFGSLGTNCFMAICKKITPLISRSKQICKVQGFVEGEKH